MGRDTTGLVLYHFWTELLEKAAERTRVHADLGPVRERFVGADAGVEALRYNYFVGEHDAGVDLSIHRGEGCQNELAFNALQATEAAISYNFGAPLDWRQKEDATTRCVRYHIDMGGYADDET